MFQSLHIFILVWLTLPTISPVSTSLHTHAHSHSLSRATVALTGTVFVSVGSQCQSLVDLLAAPALHVAGQAGLRVKVQSLGGVVVLETESGPFVSQVGTTEAQGIFAAGGLDNRSPLANTSMAWLLPSWGEAADVHVALQRDQRPTLAPVMAALADHVAAVRARLAGLLAQLQLGLVGGWRSVRSALAQVVACDRLAVCWVQNAGLSSAVEALRRVHELTEEADIAGATKVPPAIIEQLTLLVSALETNLTATQSVSVFFEWRHPGRVA